MSAADFVLRRIQARADGIFGLLSGPAGLVEHTLEHAYAVPGLPRLYAPKIPRGDYVCRRGSHRLHGMASDFTTFEITPVPGHSNLLFHWGNYNADSEGCVLLGEAEVQAGGREMITASRAAFARFLASVAGRDTFALRVEFAPMPEPLRVGASSAETVA